MLEFTHVPSGFEPPYIPFTQHIPEVARSCGLPTSLSPFILRFSLGSQVDKHSVIGLDADRNSIKCIECISFQPSLLAFPVRSESGLRLSPSPRHSKRGVGMGSRPELHVGVKDRQPVDERLEFPAENKPELRSALHCPSILTHAWLQP